MNRLRFDQIRFDNPQKTCPGPKSNFGVVRPDEPDNPTGPDKTTVEGSE